MVTLYIATSLDGFIAEENGGLDWLENPKLHAEGEDYGYVDFLKDIEVTLMGRKTYDQVRGFGEWPYSDKENYIFTSTGQVDPKHGKAIKSIDEVLSIISEKNCWLIGGGGLNNEFLKKNLIDKIILTTMPVFLGKGIPLFNSTEGSSNLIYKSHKGFPNGVVQYHFSKQNK